MFPLMVVSPSMVEDSLSSSLFSLLLKNPLYFEGNKSTPDPSSDSLTMNEDDMEVGLKNRCFCNEADDGSRCLVLCPLFDESGM